MMLGKQWAQFYTDNKGKGKVTRGTLAKFVANAWLNLDATQIGRGLEENVFSHIINATTKPNDVPEHPVPLEQGNLAAAFELLDLTAEPVAVNEEVAAEEVLLVEDEEVLTCCFCRAPNNLRKCNEPGCDQHFHHFCSIEVNGEDSSSLCKHHGT